MEKMGPDAMATEIAARLAQAIPVNAAICVGFSGGLDSTVLLDLLGEQADATGRKVTAVHVHHGLSPNADTWVKFCERFCANHGIPLAVEHVRVNADSPDGLEAAARVARYAVYASRPEPYVALAHHLDDQAETVMLQLLRGTGLKGIAAMPELRPLRGTTVQIYRPLLSYSRVALLEYAKERGLKWIEDESNASTQQDRNFLRHDIGPLLDARFPGWREAMARFARHAGAANELLDQLASVDGVPPRAGGTFALDPALSEDRRSNAMRVFLARNAVAMPSEARLAEMIKQLFEAREDAQVRIDHAGVSLVRHRGAVAIERGMINSGAPSSEPWQVTWNRESDVELGADRGSVHFDSVIGEGIGAAQAAQGGWRLQPRSGGENIRLQADRPTRTLKNLLQERDIPVWQREKLPLLFHNERLVWVPGVGIAADYACEPGQAGLLPSWRVAGKAPLC
jgi:tRNA(Ile)-lysidine synthase